jgi:hypothetical protein
MNKEFVRANLDEVTRQQPYRTYYEQRNGKIAEYVSRRLNLPVVPPEHKPGNTYEVLARTITREQAKTLGIDSPDDFYGGVVDHLQHIEKSALHACLGKCPSHYSNGFASEIQDAVLPGYSFFDEEGAEEAVNKLSGRFESLRLKLPMNSDGHGQYVVTKREEVLGIINNLDPEIMMNFGAVLEPHLFDVQTISIGEFFGEYSFIAHQIDDIAEDGRNRYKGANVEVYPRQLSSLGNNYKMDLLQVFLAEKAIKVHNAYSLLDPMFSRVSYDLLVGRDKNGVVYGGVTDVTARVGGTCPALMLVQEFMSDKRYISGGGEVLLEYQPTDQPDKHAELFIDHPTLRISAKRGHSRHHMDYEIFGTNY